MKMLFQIFYFIKKNWHIIIGGLVICFLAERVTLICVNIPTQYEQAQVRHLIACLKESDLLLNFFDEKRIEKPVIYFSLSRKHIKFHLIFSSVLSDDDSREIARKIQNIVIQEKVKNTILELEFSFCDKENTGISYESVMFYNEIINIRN